MCCECCSVTQRKVWVFGSGTIFAALGVTLIVMWPDLATKIVDKNLKIVEGSTAYDSWVHAPIPIYLAFRMFNWTNPEDIGNPNIKPRFEELGPYVYLEEHYKEQIEFYPNDTVSYYERRWWKFDAERSNGSEHDLITMLHPITATVADETRHLPKILKKIVNFMLNREGGHLHRTKPVNEWIFDGYQDDLLEFLNAFNSSKLDLPYSRFGFLAERNGTLEYDGLFTIHTGADDIAKTGQLSNWNNEKESGFYDMPCGTINGTTGDVFNPYLDTEKDLTLFVTDACRFLNFKPNGWSEHRGIRGMEFVNTPETMDSGRNYPNQQCFCNPQHQECPKAGVVDNKKCRDNAPIYASFPHFNLADESYLNAVEGLNPIREQHAFTALIEPRTGVPLKINGRLQINMMNIPDESYDIFRDTQNILMPLFWFEQKVELDADSASQAKLALNLDSYGVWAGIGFTCLGGLLWIVGIALTLTKKWKRSPSDDREELSN